MRTIAVMLTTLLLTFGASPAEAKKPVETKPGVGRVHCNKLGLCVKHSTIVHIWKNTPF